MSVEQPAEHQVLLSLIQGDVRFVEAGNGKYTATLETESVKYATRKEDRYARMVGEGITPTFKFRDQEAPIVDIKANGNLVQITVELDPLTMLPRNRG